MARLNWSATARRFESQRRLCAWEDVPDCPDWLGGTDDPLESLYAAWEDLTLKGRCVPGCIVQASPTLFRRFGSDGIATVVYSTDPRVLRQPSLLPEIAQSVYDLKTRQPENSDEAFLRSVLNTPGDRVFSQILPSSLAGEYEVFLTCTVLHRTFFPHRRLRGLMLPLSVIPNAMPDAVPVPSRYWVACARKPREKR